MYFGGTRGMIVFDPARIQENTQPPRLYVSELRLFNQVVEPGPESPLWCVPEPLPLFKEIGGGLDVVLHVLQRKRKS